MLTIEIGDIKSYHINYNSELNLIESIDGVQFDPLKKKIFFQNTN